MARNWERSWDGGRVALLKGGRRRWVLERTWLGRQYSIPLAGVRDDEGALAALYAWRADTAGFLDRYREQRRRQRDQVQGAVAFSAEALASLKQEQQRRGLSTGYIRSCQSYGQVWLQELRRPRPAPRHQSRHHQGAEGEAQRPRQDGAGAEGFEQPGW